VARQKRAPLHFRHCGTIGKKFDNFVLVRTRAFCHSLLPAQVWSLKSLTEHIWFEVSNRREFITITPKIEELVQQSGVNGRRKPVLIKTRGDYPNRVTGSDVPPGTRRWKIRTLNRYLQHLARGPE
jgi:hypothetical protein